MRQAWQGKPPGKRPSCFVLGLLVALKVGERALRLLLVVRYCGLLKRFTGGFARSTYTNTHTNTYTHTHIHTHIHTYAQHIWRDGQNELRVLKPLIQIICHHISNHACTRTHTHTHMHTHMHTHKQIQTEV